MDILDLFGSCGTAFKYISMSYSVSSHLFALKVFSIYFT